jgi:hypothetical protein
VDVYGKPTTTNTTIYFLSNHPTEQKITAFRFHTVHSLPLDPDKKTKRLGNNTNNGYKQQVSTTLAPKT